MKSHKFFALAAAACFILAMITGYCRK